MKVDRQFKFNVFFEFHFTKNTEKIKIIVSSACSTESDKEEQAQKIIGN